MLDPARARAVMQYEQQSDALKGIAYSLRGQGMGMR